MSVKFDSENRPVGTWLTIKDYEALKKLADAHKVSVAVYLRAIISDVLAEEEELAVKAVQPDSITRTSV